MDHQDTPEPKVVAIIPARYHSNRFEGKPVALILGKPMIQHVYERALSVPMLSRAVVATDDERIAECVGSFGGEVVMTRSDHASGTDRLAEAATKLDIREQDVVVNIQGDQPLFPAEVIEQVARPLLEDPTLPMSTLIYKIVRKEEIGDPNHVKTVFDRNNYALYFSRSPIPFQRDPNEWERFEKLEQLRALEFGYRIKVILTEYDSVEVDTLKDLQRVEEIMRTMQG
jgi:3-deoxy-manno-octulosonate cytidylyltransferase (CMP-KDO synthetase)